MTDYKPGTVAKATVRGVTDVTVMRSDDRKRGTLVWASSRGIEGDYWFTPDDVTDARPLVVLDIESATPGYPDIATDNIIRALRADGTTAGCRGIADQIEAQTRPAIEEPTGLGAVVEDANGVRYVRADDDGGVNWHAYGSNVSEPYWRMWPELKAVRILSEGVQP